MFTKMILVTVVLLIFVSSVATQTAPASLEPRKVTVGSYKFRLEEREGKCHLLYDGPRKGDLTLDVPPPCEFARDETGNAQHFQYKRKRNTLVYEVILVVGGPINKARSDKLMPDGCPTQMQAVSFSSRGVAVGETDSQLLACPMEGLDEKVFAILGKPI